MPDLSLSVSVTTRRPRPTERPEVDYAFVSDDEFDRMIRDDELLEWAEVFGSRYGTPAEPIRQALDEGRDVLLEIDVQGARQVRDRAPEAVLILLEPPSLEELERRLRSRGTEDEAKLRRRLEAAREELKARDWFDHVVVNEEVGEASSQVAAMISVSRDSEPPAR